MKNLGDKIALVATPIALTIDHIWGTDLEHCSGCKKSQALLNQDSSLSGIAFAVADRIKYELNKRKEKQNAVSSK